MIPSNNVTNTAPVAAQQQTGQPQTTPPVHTTNAPNQCFWQQVPGVTQFPSHQLISPAPLYAGPALVNPVPAYYIPNLNASYMPYVQPVLQQQNVQQPISNPRPPQEQSTPSPQRTKKLAVLTNPFTGEEVTLQSVSCDSEPMMVSSPSSTSSQHQLNVDTEFTSTNTSATENSNNSAVSSSFDESSSSRSPSPLPASKVDKKAVDRKNASRKLPLLPNPYTREQVKLKSISSLETNSTVTSSSDESNSRYKINGKWRYSRKDLMKLKSSPLSQQAPDLPKHVIDALRSNSKPSSRDDPFYPFPNSSSGSRGNYSGRSSTNYSGRPSGNYSGRSSQDTRNVKKIIPAPALQDVKLHTTENAWKPEHKKKSPTTSNDESDERKTSELLKNFRGFLNKITPQKYDIIEKKIKELEIDTEDRLVRILKLIFDKAVDEPAFCVQYAQLCKYLGTLSVPSNKQGDKQQAQGEKEQVQFWRLLVMRCQEEFERDIYAEIDVKGREDAIAECTDAAQKRLLEAEFEEDKRRARKKSLGIMKLIGELYRIDMLKVKIMISCVQKLVGNAQDEESIECSCTLLRTIGAKLEHQCKELSSKSPELLQQFNALFGRLQTIAGMSKNKLPIKISSRIRFLVLDVVEIQQKGWQESSIQKENRPKTISEIHAEVARQEEKSLQEHIQYSQTKDRRKSYTGASYASKSHGGQSLKDVVTMFKENRQTTPTLSLSTEFGKWGKGSYAQPLQEQRSTPKTPKFKVGKSRSQGP